MISVAQFRKDLTAFADEAVYPDDSVNYWLNLASLMINADRWGPSAADPWPSNLADPPVPPLSLYDFGVEQFIAHNLALEAKTMKAAAAGLLPGEMNGIAQSKSVDKVSVSYDTKAGIEPDAGHWALTIYGNRFLRLLRQLGAGPIHLSGECGTGGLVV